jgi:hypothetical protein
MECAIFRNFDKMEPSLMPYTIGSIFKTRFKAESRIKESFGCRVRPTKMTVKFLIKLYGTEINLKFKKGQTFN